MSTTDPRTIVRHDFPSTEWDPFLTSLFAALLGAWPKGKRPLTIAAFVPLALCALASYMGLGHLLTEERVRAAVARACPPGPKPKDDPQTSLLDVVTWPEDGRPGVFVSLVRLKLGNVRETCGQFALNLQGCHVPATATAAAIEAGWGVMPESHNSSPGLRFLPPSVVALYLAGNPAALTRPDNHAMAVRPSDSEPFVQRNAIPEGPLSSEDSVLIHEARERAAKMADEHHPNNTDPPSARTAEIGREEEPIDGPTLTQADTEELAEVCDDTTALGLMIAPPGTYGPGDFGPDSFGGSDLPHASQTDAFRAALDRGSVVPVLERERKFLESIERESTVKIPLDVSRPPSAPVAPDLTIGDAVRFTSGPHAGRMAIVFEVSADKPKAQLVGRAIELVDAIEIQADAVDVTGSDPDDAPRNKPSKPKRQKRKVRPSGIEGKARAKDGKRRAM